LYVPDLPVQTESLKTIEAQIERKQRNLGGGSQCYSGESAAELHWFAGRIQHGRAEKQAAEEDIALAIAQRKQETNKAKTGLFRAKEEALKIRGTTNNKVEFVLTDARLKMEETLYSFENEAQALVEVRE